MSTSQVKQYLNLFQKSTMETNALKLWLSVWIKVERGNKKWKILSQTHIKKKRKEPLDQETSFYTESILLKHQSCFWRGRRGLNSGQRQEFRETEEDDPNVNPNVNVHMIIWSYYFKIVYLQVSSQTCISSPVIVLETTIEINVQPYMLSHFGGPLIWYSSDKNNMVFILIILNLEKYISHERLCSRFSTEEFMKNILVVTEAMYVTQKQRGIQIFTAKLHFYSINIFLHKYSRNLVCL